MTIDSVGRSPLISESPEQTRYIARRLTESIGGPGIIALHGELGSGKTCFVQGIALALHIRQPVVSPTFTIVREYRGIRALYHIDLYRLGGPDELPGIGFEDYLESGGITAIEWAERAHDLLPASTVHVHLELTPESEHRSIRISRPPK
jgi:tRNA threonylcarbamoyladenosine biosynthesis protein TsaE